MTSRERQASGGVVLPPQFGATGSSASSTSSPPAVPGLPPWDDLWQAYTPAQQQEVFSLAARQGVVYRHQLPPHDLSHRGSRRLLLDALLAGRLPGLPSFVQEPVTLHDNELDAAQRQAVARALHTPDLCLIQGSAGTGKSRVVAEILLQATTRGERVLFVAPSSAALDRVLEQIGAHPHLYPIRCLGSNEHLEELSPAIRRLTFAERVRHLQEDSVQGAQAEIASSQQRLDQFAREEAIWPRLEQLLQTRHQLEALTVDHQSTLGRLSELVNHDALQALRDGVSASTAFHAEIRSWSEQREAQLRQVQIELEEAGQKHTAHKLRRDQLHGESQTLHPLVEARRGRRWWTLPFWHALFQPKLIDRHTDILSEIQRLDQELEALVATQKSLQQAEQQRHEESERTHGTLLRKEEERRRQELETCLARLTQEREETVHLWQRICEELSEPTSRPTTFSSESLQTARQCWLEQRAAANHHLGFAQRWVEELARASATFPDRLLTHTNLVAALMGSLADDPHFGTNGDHSYDLLVIEEADQVTETDFHRAASQCRRWVLVGEPAPEQPPLPRGKHGRPERAAVRPGFYHRLWEQLHNDPRRLPVRWEQHAEQLICRLRRVPPEQQQWVELEPLADCPEVVLGILAPPRTPPLLVEVIFPASRPISQAKAFLFQELQEVTAQSSAAGGIWIEDAERIRLQFHDEITPEDREVTLTPGVSEWVRALAEPEQTADTPFETLAFTFSTQAGWTRSRAEEWLAQQAGIHDCGRTTFLSRSHRMLPSLAKLLSDWLRAESRLRPVERGANGVPSPGWGGWTEPVGFVSVPPLHPSSGLRRAGLHTNDGRRGHSAGATATLSRQRQARGGAGLEIDLSDTSHPPQLSPELRAQLPTHGLVNLQEAQAVVRMVEGLVQDPRFRAEACAWQRRMQSPCMHHSHPCQICSETQARQLPALGVTALYPAQVQLIHTLLRQSTPLARAGVLLCNGSGATHSLGTPSADPLRIEVAPPAGLRQREYQVLLLSLTRSHTHRAVRMGEDAHWLPLALTRACHRLILFGDPGTLIRRTQWHGPLEQLDETEATRERELIDQVVQYIQGQGLHSDHFHVCEGSGV